jgi:STE24 endopeptidase
LNAILSNSVYGLLWIAPFLLERVADLLQLRLASQPLPENLRELQTPEDHSKSYHYAQDRKRLEWFSLTLSLLFWFGFWKIQANDQNGFQSLAYWAEAITSTDTSTHPFLAGIAFIAFLSLIQSLIDLPFQIYSTFVIEEKYGFNRTTWKLFLSDGLKGLLLSVVIGVPLLLITYQFLSWELPFPFLWLWAAYLTLQVFLLWIAPVVLLPLFLKLSPLPEGPLKATIEAYREKQTFKLNGVWVCDASKRSAKSNAFFTGFGKFRRLVLFDTLIAQQTPEEITAVVAHEAGHFQRGHILKGMVISSLTMLFSLWAALLLLDIPQLYFGFGFSDTRYFHFAFGLPLAITVVGKLLYPLKVFTSALSRKHEYEADHFAVETTGSGKALARALKKLSRENLSGIQVHPLYAALHLSHPPLPDRLKALEGNRKN